MTRTFCVVFLFLVGLAVQKPVDAQIHCTLRELYGSCPSCDGASITGQAPYDLFGECYPCVARCPQDRSPERSENGAKEASIEQPLSCGLTWNQFAEQAAEAENADARAAVRYVRLDPNREFLNVLAARAPMMVNFFVVRDGHIRVGDSDPSLASDKIPPAMISGFVASAEMAGWLIERRASILTESGRQSLKPPPRRRLPPNERQVLYTNVEGLGESRMRATLRTKRFAVAEEGSGRRILDEQVLVLELTAGQVQRIPDRVRPILGDNQPGSRLNARIDDYSLTRHSH